MLQLSTTAGWRTAIVSLALAVSATGCGDDADQGLSEAEQVAADSIADYYRVQDVTKKAATCLGDGWVSEFGLKKLEQLSVIDAEGRAVTPTLEAFATLEQTTPAATIYVDCLTPTVVLQALYQTSDNQAANCLLKSLGEDALVASLAAGAAKEKGPKLSAKTRKEMRSCVKS